jgi:hypothetical protein
MFCFEEGPDPCPDTLCLHIRMLLEISSNTNITHKLAQCSSDSRIELYSMKPNVIRIHKNEKNKKSLEELVAYFPFILHGAHETMRPTILRLIRCRGNVFICSPIGKWPVLVRPLLSSKRRPRFIHIKIWNEKNMVICPETKTDCGGKGEQQFTAMLRSEPWLTVSYRSGRPNYPAVA